MKKGGWDHALGKLRRTAFGLSGQGSCGSVGHRLLDRIRCHLNVVARLLNIEHNGTPISAVESSDLAALAEYETEIKHPGR